jgi:hypothetical protein
MSRRFTHARPRSRRVLLGLAAAALSLLGPAPGAQASSKMLSAILDDNVLLYGSNQARNNALAVMKANGTDLVRVTVLWEAYAPAQLYRGFDGTNPAKYPSHYWDRLDRLVYLAHQYGIGVLLNVTGPGPKWAHYKTNNPALRISYRPKTNEFYKFVQAVGRRYSGGYRDENEAHALLPRVSVWSIWNEPNQGRTLSPQSYYSAKLKKWVPLAPALYRSLYYAGLVGLRKTGHGNDQIYIGETAPLGVTEVGPRKQLRPKLFIREFFCLDRHLRPYRGEAAKARLCDQFSKLVKQYGPVQTSGWAHHPYTQQFAPWHRDYHPDSINMSNVPQLGYLLDQIANRTHLIAKGLPIELTEIGWQTNPPDPTDQGISLQKQAEYMNAADYMAYVNPRVNMQTQFLLLDVNPQTQFRDNKRRWFTWQSGLYFANLAPKPALDAYRLPFQATVSSSGTPRTVSIWGQLRFRPNNTPVDYISIQWRPFGGATWTQVGPLNQVSDPLGYFRTTRLAPGPGIWRLQWASEAGTANSRSIQLDY